MRISFASALRKKLRHAVVVAITLVLAACNAHVSSSDPLAVPSTPSSKQIGHVFIIVLENESYATTFGANSPAPYLAQTLPAHGALLQRYYGTAHNSQSNYVAMISGLGTNLQMQLDCQIFDNFYPVANAGVGQIPGGSGCVFPAKNPEATPSSYPTLPDQLEAAGLTWRGYMEDMGNDPTRESATCGHPAINALDNTQSATAIDMYATRHNPFVYFHDIIDDADRCNTHVVNLTALQADLASASATPNFVFITPNLCNDGHDGPCEDGAVGGLEQADLFLQKWVPLIVASPAFRADGLLIVTFDESEGLEEDSSACCGETGLSGITGPGGGLIGGVMLSPFIKPGTVSTFDYNHFSMLRSIEDMFGFAYLGYAGDPAQASFGTDIFTQQMPVYPPKP
jgi:hypothetical protein